MNGLLQLDQLAQLSAGALVVAALGIIYLIMKSGLDGFTKLSSAQTSANAQAFQATSMAFTESVRTLKDAQEGQRLFYTGKLDDVRGEVASLRDRVRELEAESDSKDERIKELERENERLTNEVDQLRKQLDGKEPRKKSKKEVPIEKTRVIGGGARVPAGK